jgi:methylmalonyl-CoA mutase C-terminal domain/subunit
MNEKRKKRVLVAKAGLDGHDRGAKAIARLLKDSGMEVIYTGLHQTSEQIVNAAIQEDVDVIGLSILSGTHMGISKKILRNLKERGAEKIGYIVGGIIIDRDIEALKRMGVAEVFPMGSDIDDIVAFFEKFGNE